MRGKQEQRKEPFTRLSEKALFMERLDNLCFLEDPADLRLHFTIANKADATVVFWSKELIQLVRSYRSGLATGS